MLNDVLAVCVAGAVVVVIATILGAVELLWKAVAAMHGQQSRNPEKAPCHLFRTSGTAGWRACGLLSRMGP